MIGGGGLATLWLLAFGGKLEHQDCPSWGGSSHTRTSGFRQNREGAVGAYLFTALGRGEGAGQRPHCLP